MLAQGVLGFQYEAEGSSVGLTSLAGLPLYLDLIHASGLGAAIRQHVRVAGTQGWLDVQMVVALIFLNLAGGDCMEDLERLERDNGFAAVLRAIERELSQLGGMPFYIDSDTRKCYDGVGRYLEKHGYIEMSRYWFKGVTQWDS